MKIQIKSDLHLEAWHNGYFTVQQGFYRPFIQEGVDVLILAGDIASWRERFKLHYMLGMLQKQHPSMQIIYIMGNHEYYGAPNVNMVHPELKALMSDLPNVHFLENEDALFTIEDVAYKFLGTTLWNRGWTNLKNGNRLNSLACVKDGEACPGITPQWMEEKHNLALKFLDSNLIPPREKFKTIVVTHHAPSLRSVAHKYLGDVCNFCFATDLEYVMEEHKPTLWVHGHMHDPFDYEVGNTRVICNPRGYPSETNVFDEELVIEI
jgi:predicted MPP superfamily phosphohydrolase